MRIETNNSGMDFYTYKQGYWFLKNGTDSDPDWKEITLTDKDGKEYKEFGVYVSALGGIVSDLALEDIEHEGRKFSVLNVTLDGREKLSMSFPSEASRKVLQQFENLDFSKKVILTAWQKDGWAKLNIKQDGDHVKNSFLNWKAETKTMETLNGYPVRQGKDADEREKLNFNIDEKEFLRAQATKIKGLIPEFTSSENNLSEEDAYEQAIAGVQEEDIDPSLIDF